MAYICFVCGRDTGSGGEPCPWCEPPSEHEVEEKPRATACVQDYLDLDAGGCLLVALGHLVKAREKLDQEPPSSARWHAKQLAMFAANYVRRALALLDELKEETCET